MSTHRRIVELCAEIQVASKRIEQSQQALESLLGELTKQVVARLKPSLVNSDRPVSEIPRLSQPHRRGGPSGPRSGSIAMRITEYLGSRATESVGLVEIHQALKLRGDQKGAVASTLSRLVSNGRIKRGENGYQTA